MKPKTVEIIGYLGSALSLFMFGSCIPQILDTLHGHPGNPIQPFAAFFNCLIWTLYGLGSTPKKWPIVIANAPGIFLAAAAFLTSFHAFF